MFDKGEGPTVVVVQPLQGRWQWMRRFLGALSGQCRVITYTLAGDFGADRPLTPAEGFDQFVRQLEDVVSLAGVGRFALCGISFGGTVAVRYAALHPERVTHLVIASSPGPGWRPTAEQRRYVTRPLLALPVFLWAASRRLRAELKASLPGPWTRLAFAAWAARTALHYPALPTVMAKRVRLMESIDLSSDCARICVPTLVITGEPALDHVVPVESTRRYLTHIRNSRYEMMDGTGHTGSLMQPERFARIVGTFVNAIGS